VAIGSRSSASLRVRTGAIDPARHGRTATGLRGLVLAQSTCRWASPRSESAAGPKLGATNPLSVEHGAVRRVKVVHDPLAVALAESDVMQRCWPPPGGSMSSVSDDECAQDTTRYRSPPTSSGGCRGGYGCRAPRPGVRSTVLSRCAYRGRNVVGRGEEGGPNGVSCWRVSG
jgi:hypothetical protein